MHSKLARDTERAQKQLIEKNVHRKVKRNTKDEEEQREKHIIMDLEKQKQ